MDPKTVLLVEDDEDSRTICSTVLEHHGYRILAVPDGEEGVRAAISKRPDLILMDVSLPGLDGWAATQRIKTEAATAGIPVVMVTAAALDADRDRARRLGCAGFIAKPCSPRMVLREVERLIGPAQIAQPLEPPSIST